LKSPATAGGRSKAPAFKLVGKDLADVSLAQFAGKRKVLNIVPSLDTPVCATSTRKFNESAGKTPNTVVLVISPICRSRWQVLHQRGSSATVDPSVDHAPRDYAQLWRRNQPNTHGVRGLARTLVELAS